MGYRALYREYRPQRFADIAGQEHITRTLQNAICSGRVSHAYLFCGPRGTGKTSTAKVLAKTLNCVNAPVEEPCNHCQNCIATTEGTSVDVIEIDAASNRGIEDIRDLREKVKYSPAHGKYRIYIIDEVHMLTTEAFNALLKTLEEPPGHVIFVLATTEPHKVPVTILSRCQRFDFRRISVDVMVARLKQVADSAGLTVEEEALMLIAGVAEGGLRDALSILDQGAVYGNNKITVADVHNLLGTVGEEVLTQMADHLASANTAATLTLINNLYQQGKDLRLFVKELSTYLRSLMLYLVSNGLPDTNQQSIKLTASKFKPKQISNYLEILTKLEYDMKWSSQPKVLLELALVKMTVVEEEADSHYLLEKLKILEQHLHQISATGNLNSNKANSAAEQRPGLNDATTIDGAARHRPNLKQQSEPVKQIQPTGSAKKIKPSWNKVLERVKKLKPSLYGVFCEAEIIDAEEQLLTIGFKPQHSSFHKVRAEQSDNKAVLEQALNDELGGNWGVKVIAIEKLTELDNEVKKNAEIEHPLVKRAIEMFGRDKVVVSNHHQ
ncbi:DNA polymerase III subunit gamma/tau [Peptococcaceae bacterium 1198_IL3148]